MSANSERDREPIVVNCDNLNLTAYALDQLDESERAEIERQLAEASGNGARLVEQTRRLAKKVREALVTDAPAALAALRETLIQRMGEPADDGGSQHSEATKPQLPAKPQSFWRRHAVELVAASLIVVLLVALMQPATQSAREASRRMQAANNLRQLGTNAHSYHQQHSDYAPSDDVEWYRYQQTPSDSERLQRLSEEVADLRMNRPARSTAAGAGIQPDFTGPKPARGDGQSAATLYYSYSERSSAGAARNPDSGVNLGVAGQPAGGPARGAPGANQPLGDERGAGQQDGQLTDLYGAANPTSNGQGQSQSGEGWAFNYRARVQQGGESQGRRMGGGQGQGIRPNVNYDTYQPLGGRRDGLPNNTEYGGGEGQPVDPRAFGGMRGAMGMSVGGAMPGGMMMPGSGPGTEQYAPIIENNFIPVQGQDALSTFSIDVDTASYANVRRFLTQGQLPPANAVRLEELVNYFSYDYPQPKAGDPFSVNMEVAECPWQQKHLLLRVGLKGREIHHKERPVSNLVFLLDVSGSMADENKLPLLKQVLSMMVRELREDDRVSIVTYAGEAGLRLPSTTGDQQDKILGAIDALSSGGSTNGSAGIELAYDQAQSYFRKEGTNRVILATDGDLNVGITDDESLVQLIKQKAAGGVFLTVLGFGEGNLKDAKMERLADNGNGLYAYIDSVREGRKVLVEQMSGSLVTIAKDVKIQVEFNPREVQSYRLLGYENRMLTAPEFNDDKRDAGEIGAGHSVTALYELAPAGTQLAGNQPEGETTLRYQAGERGQESGVRGQEGKFTDAAASGELLTLKLRYKEPDGQASKLSEYPLKNRGGKFQGASKDFQFAAAVASFGMLLRNSQYRGDGNLAATAEIASAAIGEDKGGYRAEFVDLVRKAQSLGVK